MNTAKVVFLAASAADYYNKNGWGSEYAANALHNLQNFINYQSWIVNIFTSIKWWLIKLVYGLANAASEILNKMLNVTSFLNTGADSKSEFGQFINYAKAASFILLAVALVIMGISLFVSKHPPEIKSIVLQAVTAIILILEVGPATNWIVQQSTNLYHGVVQTSGKKGTSSLPFEILRSSTNDLEYLISNNFTPTPASPNQSKIKGAGDYTKPIAPPRAKFGYNDLSQSEVDHGDVPFDQIITWNDVDSNMPLWNKDKEMGHNDSHKGKFFLFAWLMHQPQTMTDKKDKKVYLAPDIQRIGGTGGSSTIFSFGGYPRFSVDTLPTLISLGALAVAFMFAGFAIVKSIIELGLMQILSVFLFATDNSEGSRTKRVITTMFSLSILIGLQGLELAFYKIVMIWGINAKNKGTFGTGIVCDWSFVIIAVVATVMLMSGSQHVAMFFGVDTGAQHGLRSAVMTGAATASLARNTGNAVKSVAHGASNLRSKAEQAYQNQRDKNANKSKDSKDKQTDRPTVDDKMSSFNNPDNMGEENNGPMQNPMPKDSNSNADKNEDSTSQRQDTMSNRAERNVSHSSGKDTATSSGTGTSNSGSGLASGTGSSTNATAGTDRGSSSSSLKQGQSTEANRLRSDSEATDLDSPRTQALRRQLNADVNKQKNMYAKPEKYSPNQVQKQDDIVRKDRQDLKQSQLQDRARVQRQSQVNKMPRKSSSLQKPSQPNNQIMQGKVKNSNPSKMYRPEEDPRRPKR